MSLTLEKRLDLLKNVEIQNSISLLNRESDDNSAVVADGSVVFFVSNVSGQRKFYPSSNVSVLVG